MKEYNTPTLVEVEVEIEDVIAASNNPFGSKAGDLESPFGDWK